MANGIKGKGTKKSDLWNGTLGDDSFSAAAGNDTCNGGAGNDKMDCGAGNDVADGGKGNDIINGDRGGDTLVGGAGNDKLSGGVGDDDLSGGAGNDKLYGGAGNDSLNGDAGNDRVFGDAGDDTVNGGSGDDFLGGGDNNDSLNGDAGKDIVFGDAGDDNVNGGAGDDFLDGGDGNDFVIGGTGNDRMIGGLGDDTLDWDDGEGNDVMSGNEGRDTIEVDGSVALGDNFVLGKNSTGNAFFERVGLDGQPNGQFNLIVDSAEVFDVSGEGGNDTFIVNDLSGTGVEVVQFDGGAGNDSLDARASSTRVEANGGEGDDILTGGTGKIVVSPTSTLGDTLTGGVGKDKFQFLVDPFSGGTPGQNLNQPDVVTDFEFSTDQLVFGKQQFGIDQFNFQKGQVGNLQDGNLLVLEGKFANAGEASKAIAANDKIKADKGVFVYYNSTLGFSRTVFSQDLSDGGPFSVQANLTNLTDSALQANFTAADFGLA
jgi:Ca2+-binding RTX toxin-like protein